MTQTANPAVADIENAVKTHDVVLFMKGSKSFPQCGFSSRVVSILGYMRIDFHDVNVLESDALRQGVKEFTQWPTIPQLYVKGEFVGGCDIVTEMTMSGELDQMLDAKGVAYDKAAADKLRAENS